MKKNTGVQSLDFCALFAFCSLLLLITSCTTPVSWAPDYDKEARGTVHVDISVYKAGGMASIEEELRTLAPFFLLKNRLLTAHEGENAGFTMEIQAHEREYQSGWDAKRSLSLSVRFLDGNGNTVSAAQVISNKGTLSDAKKLKTMLAAAAKLALRKAAKALKWSGR
ncbi:MAG: hypothetical protein LBG43_08470 [Treponema sp.]|jgi:hypothetical protein|nr:hypothetical protein [Treponema sp.]